MYTRVYTYIGYLESKYKCVNKIEKCQETLVYTFRLNITVLFNETFFFLSRTWKGADAFLSLHPAAAA